MGLLSGSQRYKTRKAAILKPLVSILIPAYNAEETIAASIQSALDQTWQRKEIIVVNDGSSDRTAEMAERFGSNVTVVSTENRGLRQPATMH